MGWQRMDVRKAVVKVKASSNHDEIFLILLFLHFYITLTS